MPNRFDPSLWNPLALFLMTTWPRGFFVFVSVCVCVYIYFLFAWPRVSMTGGSGGGVLVQRRCCWGVWGIREFFFLVACGDFFLQRCSLHPCIFFGAEKKLMPNQKKNTAARFEEPKNNRPPPYPSLTIMSYSRGFFFALPSPFPKNSLPNPSASSAVHFFFLVSWCVCVH